MTSKKQIIRKNSHSVKGITHSAILRVSICAVFTINAVAQNTSYNVNSVPIGGTNNTGIGFNALNPGTSGSNNSAFGVSALNANTSGYYNTALGSAALYFNTTGFYNNAIGVLALHQNINGNNNTANGLAAMQNNTSGSFNTATGSFASYLNTTGNNNVANGNHALYSNTGSFNTADGSQSLFNNTSGSENTAVGSTALYLNQTGIKNTAVGVQALYANTASGNSALGYQALRSNASGSENTAVGYQALYNNSSLFRNTAVGYRALYNSNARENTAMGWNTLYQTTSGEYNTAVGNNALFGNTTGNFNAAFGGGALGISNSSNGTAIGNQAYYLYNMGNNCTALGYNTNPSGNGYVNATAIGAGAIVSASNRVQLGNFQVIQVECNSGVYTTSDARFKSNIKAEDVKGLEFIKILRPVVYNLDTKKLTEYMTKNMPADARAKYMEGDFTESTNIRQSGFLAQEVEAAAKKVGYDFNGVYVPKNENEHYSLSYAEFVVPLVKAIQEQQVQIETDSKTISDLRTQLNAQQKQIDELKAMMLSNANIGKKANIQTIEMSDKNTVVLNQNVPNPFAESTTISYVIPSDFIKAQIIISNSDGKVIKTVDIKEKGSGSLNVFANDLSSGVYSYTLVIDGKNIDTRRMIKD